MAGRFEEGVVRAGCAREGEKLDHTDSKCPGQYFLRRIVLERSLFVGEDPVFTSVTGRGENQ